jgi:hypothetical protein
LRKFVHIQRKRRDFLESLLLEGLESGGDLKVTPQFWSDVKAEATALLTKHSSKPRQRRKG